MLIAYESVCKKHNSFFVQHTALLWFAAVSMQIVQMPRDKLELTQSSMIVQHLNSPIRIDPKCHERVMSMESGALYAAAVHPRISTKKVTCFLTLIYIKLKDVTIK